MKWLNEWNVWNICLNRYCLQSVVLVHMFHQNSPLSCAKWSSWCWGDQKSEIRQSLQRILEFSKFCFFHQFYLYSKKRLKLKSADVERMARGLRGDDRHIVWGLKWKFATERQEFKEIKLIWFGIKLQAHKLERFDSLKQFQPT